MNVYSRNIRDRATELRKNGLSYGEIEKNLGITIPKGTLAYWCREITFSSDMQALFKERNALNLKAARKLGTVLRKQKRLQYLQGMLEKNQSLGELLNNSDIAKIALAVLYLGEGSKNIRRGFLTFGNSDPDTIKLFFRLLRSCYTIEDSRFRCTVQCRADQNVKVLENFWSGVTGIPLEKFYEARIDKRTSGIISRNKEYKGVCRIDYFSAEIFIDILMAIKVVKSTVNLSSLTNLTLE